LNGKIHKCDEHGKLVIPYAHTTINQPILLIDEKDGFVCLHPFYHQRENYVLDAGIYVDRESLLPGNTAQVVVRSSLYVNDAVAPLSLVEDGTLELITKDLDGVEVVNLVKDFQLKEDRESIFPFEVPNNLQSLVVNLTGKVKVVSTGAYTAVSQQATFSLNIIDTENKIHDVFLRQNNTGYHLFACDKTGEALVSDLNMIF
jgi:hypothetical protein